MAGRPLPLVDQLDYTDGLCAPFALAARDLLGGRIELLYAADPRQFRMQDWPFSMPLCLHAYLAFPEGLVIDAEGCRPAEEMRRSFGIRKGWSFRVEIDEDGTLLQKEFRRTISEIHINAARQQLEACGWEHGVPEATGELTRRFKEARAKQRRRAEDRRKIAEADHDADPGAP